VSTRPLAGFAVLILLAVLGGAQADDGLRAPTPEQRQAFRRPITFPQPAGNPSTAQKVALGRELFFDPRLSGDGQLSCASCHNPALSWQDGLPTGIGHMGARLPRRTQTILDVAWAEPLFWDGRADSLEEQAKRPLSGAMEMNMPPARLEARVRSIPGYVQRFDAAFPGQPITVEVIAKAIAAFERTVLSGDAPYDRFQAGDKTALSESAQRGLKLFNGKANCKACHVGPNFSDSAFHNIGLESKDEGRKTISKLDGDFCAMKTPTLRDIARTGPYMHLGHLKTLEEVVAHYNKGGNNNPQQDEEVFPLKLTDQEQADLVTFLKEGLTSSQYPHVEKPTLPE
jgi:cytochrome c peroxidase